MKRTWLILIVALLAQIGASSQTKAPAAKITLIKAGHLIDVRTGQVLANQGILVAGERIRRVGPVADVERAAAGAKTIDLSNATVLPGLADCHTHILLQGDITSEDYDVQLLKESIPYRTIRATVAARTGLLNGFTVMRDLETEG